MTEILNGESITSETLTKTIMQACIQSIIVINKHEIVFVIPSEEKANYLTIKERRHELIKNPPIIEGKVIHPRRFRTEKLIYKVVMM